MTPDIAIVLGTYNRLVHLQAAITSIRTAAGALTYEIIVVDGGSTDGSREWLAAQPDVVLIGQRGPLTGAVIAFNLGFAYAVDSGAPFVCHFNDDAEFLDGGPTDPGPAQLELAVAHLREHPEVGEAAFEFDLRKGWSFEQIHGRAYANFGVVRREAGMAVARAQGDPSGKAWWSPLYRTYGADCEFACWLWKLGWTIHPLHGVRVHDANVKDELRILNQATVEGRPDSKMFWNRWLPAENVQKQLEVQQVAWADSHVHLGCGTHHLKGWLNVDGLAGPAVDLVLDFAELHRIPSRKVTEIYWCHGPEHVHPDKLGEVMAHLQRALKPGGKLLVATISLEGIWHNRYKSTKNGGAWNAALYGEADSKDHPFLSHKQAFTQETLEAVLRTAKFKDVKPWELEQYPYIHKLNDYATSCRLVTVLAEGVA